MFRKFIVLFVIQHLLNFLFLFNANAEVEAIPYCPMNGDKIDVSEISSLGVLTVCDAPVTSFNIEVFQLALCTSDPTEFLKGNEIENPCFYLWDHNQGDNAISFGVTKSSETSFPATLPPTGVYTHGFGTISATTGITAEFEFDEQKIFGGNSGGTGWYSAPFLNSPQSFIQGGNRNVTMKDFIDMNYPKFTETFTESQASINEFSFTYNSLSSATFSNINERVYRSPHNGNYGRSILLNDNYELATSYDQASKIAVVEDYSNPKVMTDQINTILYKYSPDYDARLSFMANGDNGILVSIFFGNSQFTIEFE